MELPRVLDVGEVLGHRPSRHVLRDHLRSRKQEDLISFYMAAQKFAADADFSEESSADLVEEAKKLVLVFKDNKTIKKSLKETGVNKAISDGAVTGIVFGPSQRTVLAEITRLYREFEESKDADVLFNMLSVHLADGAGIDVSGLREKEKAREAAAAATLSVPEDGVLANESGGLVAPPHTPRGGSVDLTGKKSTDLMKQAINKRSSLRFDSMESILAGEKSGERKAGGGQLGLGAMGGKSKGGVQRLAFHDVVYNPLGLEMLRTFMHTEHNEENLHFHLAVRAFRRRVQSHDDMIKEAESLWTRFMDEASQEEVTISAAIKKALRSELDTHPSKTSFDSTDRSVVKTILSDVFRRFSSSGLHNKYVEKLSEMMKDLQRKAVVHRRGKSVQLAEADGRGDVALEDVVMDPELLAAYMEFCANEYSEEGILFWCAADEYSIAHEQGQMPEEIAAIALEIKDRHMRPNAPYEVALDASLKRKALDQINSSNFSADLFDGLKDGIFSSLKNDSFQRFVESPDYRRLRQLPTSPRGGCFSSCFRKKK